MEIKHEFEVTSTPPPPPLMPRTTPFATRPSTPVVSSASTPRVTIQLPPILNPFLVRPSPPPPAANNRPQSLSQLLTSPSPSLVRPQQVQQQTNASAPSSFVLVESNGCCRNKCCYKCCPVVRHELYHRIQAVVQENDVTPLDYTSTTPVMACTQSYAALRKGTEIGVGLRGSLLQRARWIRAFLVENKKGYVRSVDRDEIIKLIDDFISATKKQ